jgi:transposase InsO family protein
MTIRYIEPGKPNQNANIERFNRTCREEVLSLYLFRNLAEVRETTCWWMIEYSEDRSFRTVTADVKCPPGLTVPRSRGQYPA